MLAHVYVATTSDIYELPCCVGTAQEVATFLGMTIKSFYCAISRKTINHSGYHLYKVELNED